MSVIAPHLTEAPTLDQQNGMLHLKGYFPGQPVQINFEVIYQSFVGRWRLFGLSVQPSSPNRRRSRAALQPRPPTRSEAGAETGLVPDQGPYPSA
jgi:hypothetical protein